MYQIARRGDKFAAKSVAPQLVALTHQLQSFRLGTIALSYVGAAGLPLTHNGKIQHAQLREEYLSGELARKRAILYPEF